MRSRSARTRKRAYKKHICIYIMIKVVYIGKLKLEKKWLLSDTVRVDYSYLLVNMCASGWEGDRTT